MPAKRYVVTLTTAEREQLEALVRSGRRSARTITRARVLLLADQGDGGPGWEDRRVAEHATPTSIGNVLHPPAGGRV